MDLTELFTLWELRFRKKAWAFGYLFWGESLDGGLLETDHR